MGKDRNIGSPKMLLRRCRALGHGGEVDIAIQKGRIQAIAPT